MLRRIIGLGSAIVSLALLATATTCPAATMYSVTDLGRAYPYQDISIDSSGHVEEIAGVPYIQDFDRSKTAGGYTISDSTTQLLGGIEVTHAYFGAPGQTPTEVIQNNLGYPFADENYTYITSVNASGTAIGLIYNQAFWGLRPFQDPYMGGGTLGIPISYTRSGGMQLVATPYDALAGQQYGAAFAINDAGQIVGTATSTSVPSFTTDKMVAFLTEGQQSWDLNTLIALGSGFLLSSATGIDDSGQIVGGAFDTQDGTDHFYLLTPLAPRRPPSRRRG